MTDRVVRSLAGLCLVCVIVQWLAGPTRQLLPLVAVLLGLMLLLRALGISRRL